MVPEQTWPLRVARNVMSRLPGLLAILRSTLNEPLRPPVVAVLLEATDPLSLIFQLQVWPERLLSTSPSTSRRPSSRFTFSFQRAPSEQLPVLMTRSSPPPPPPLPLPPLSSPGPSSSPEAYAGAPR